MVVVFLLGKCFLHFFHVRLENRLFFCDLWIYLHFYFVFKLFLLLALLLTDRAQRKLAHESRLVVLICAVNRALVPSLE